MKKDTTINLKKLEGLKHKFLDFLKDVSLKRKHEKSYEYLAQSYGPHGTTLQWGDISYSEAITSVQKLCPNISTKQIAKSLSGLMIKIFDEQVVEENATGDFELETISEVLDLSNIASDLSQMISSLRKLARQQVILVPIEGLKMKVNSLEVGTVTFYPRSNESELNMKLKDIEQHYGEDTKSISRDLMNVACYTRIEAVGDSEFVRDQAIKRTKEAIHILNLYLSSSRHQPEWQSIHSVPIIINYALPDNEHENDGIGFNQSYSGQRRFEIDGKKEDSLTQMGLKTMNGYFQSQSNTDIGKRIRQAVTWYSKAVDTDSPEEKFVNLAIALESLIIGDEGEEPFATTASINQKIGERVAFLLGDNFDSRVSFEKKAKKLYGLRSKIVHRGESVTKENLAEMDKLVGQVILAFLKHEFNNWSMFQEWVAHERYNKVSSL